MEQLTTMAASFLEAEDADRHLSLAIGALAIIDGPIPGREKPIATLSERTRAEPRFTQVVRNHPLEYRAPEWIEDTNFDITHHVRWAALPQPGDDAALPRRPVHGTAVGRSPGWRAHRREFT
jgi:diacylglycerol O-acyltransferase / wax synthase